jgi:hypothetical protein
LDLGVVVLDLQQLFLVLLLLHLVDVALDLVKLHVEVAQVVFDAVEPVVQVLVVRYVGFLSR